MRAIQTSRTSRRRNGARWTAGGPWRRSSAWRATRRATRTRGTNMRRSCGGGARRRPRSCCGRGVRAARARAHEARRAPPRDGDRRGARRAGDPARRAAGGLDPVQPADRAVPARAGAGRRPRLVDRPSRIGRGGPAEERARARDPDRRLRRELGQPDEQGAAEVRRPTASSSGTRRRSREAMELHGIPADRLRATGAHSSTSGSSGSPLAPPRSFASTVGLDPALPFVVYFCSSPPIARNAEVPFVREWLAALRGERGRARAHARRPRSPAPTRRERVAAGRPVGLRQCRRLAARRARTRSATGSATTSSTRSSIARPSSGSTRPR